MIRRRFNPLCFIQIFSLLSLVACFPAIPARAEFGDLLLKFSASDASAPDGFGYSSAISGNFAIVGASRNDDACPNNADCDSGSAYVFDVLKNQELFKLTASDAAAGDRFGNQVAISGNTALVSAWGDDDACPNDANCNSGSAYVFDVTTGQELFKLTATDAAAGDRLGLWGVAISGNTAIVGAHGKNNFTGAAYLFDVTTGQELFKLTASDAVAGSDFGDAVDISDNRAIVGGSGTHQVYLFDVSTGQELHQLTTSNTTAQFGFAASVAIEANTAIVG